MLISVRGLTLRKQREEVARAADTRTQKEKEESAQRAALKLGAGGQWWKGG